MPDQDPNDVLESAFQRGLKHQNLSITERLENLEVSTRDIHHLANFSVLGLPLAFHGIKGFFECSGIALTDEEHLIWLVPCLEMNLFLRIEDSENNIALWRPKDDVCAYIATHSEIQDLKQFHLNADRFILNELTSFATRIGVTLPAGDKQREAIIGPNNFLNYISHLPQYQDFHHSILNLAITWFDHLFWLEAYLDAANILNHICFALARRGQRKMVENMLAVISTKTTGLTRLVAQINLATLLREERQLSAAIQIYWRTIPGLVRHGGYVQLAQVFSEIATVYREKGNLFRSVILLELSVMLNRLLKNRKSTAIAHSQLASTYRYLKLYFFARTNSRLAVDHFRKTNDFLNLGRSLLTQGNIQYNLLKSDLALQCFDEAFEIGQQIADPQAEIGATSGKARVFLFLKKYDEAQSLLNQAIHLREKYNDHSIGIEYQNMGAAYEQKGDFSMALGWYQKALVQFEKYMPIEVPACQKNIDAVQAKYRAQRQ